MGRGFSDRHAKRFQLLVSDLVAAAALTTIPAAALAGVLTIGQLYGVTLAVGAAKVVRDAAAISLLPAVVAPQLLHDANSRLGAASSVADSAGSNVGAALVGTVGAARSLLVDAASFLASACLVWRIRAPEPHAPRVGAEKQRGLIRDIAAGVRYVIGQPTIRTVIAALAVLSFGLALMNTFWAYYLLTALGISPTAFGVIMSAGGMGSLVGALLTSRMTDRFGVGPVIITGFVVSPSPRCRSFWPGPAAAGRSSWPQRSPSSCSGRRLRSQPAHPSWGVSVLFMERPRAGERCPLGSPLTAISLLPVVSGGDEHAVVRG